MGAILIFFKTSRSASFNQIIALDERIWRVVQQSKIAESRWKMKKRFWNFNRCCVLLFLTAKSIFFWKNLILWKTRYLVYFSFFPSCTQTDGKWKKRKQLSKQKTSLAQKQERKKDHDEKRYFRFSYFWMQNTGVVICLFCENCFSMVSLVLCFSSRWPFILSFL